LVSKEISNIKKNRIAAAERLGIDLQNMPHHIAIIMDGNGRWATQRGLPRFQGHRQGARTVEKIVDYCVDIGI
jgi:undecaprenyl diphosphate synthase